MKKLMTAVLLAATCTAAIANDTPASLAGATLVDASKAKSLMEGGAKMIDARVAAEYAEAHIKGAVSAPYKEKSAKAADFDVKQDDASGFLAKLGSVAKKDDNVIVQCNGQECWKSYKGAKVALSDGYKHVYWFRGGLPEWKAKGFPIE